MRKIFILLLCTALAFSFTACIKQIDKTYDGPSVAEIDAAVLNSVTTGLTYPVMTRIPAQGRPVNTSDSTLRRLNGLVRVRVNLVGPQSSETQTVGYRLFNAPISSISFPATATGQTPSRPSGTLTLLDAIAGTHYQTLTGVLTIPANSSFGFIDVNILPATAATNARFIGIQLDSSGTVLPSVNYRTIGLAIDQR